MEMLAVAASSGITAVPTYVFDGEWAVPGAQDPELFERILNRLLDRESATAAESPAAAAHAPADG
jgi:predicted DsbA family dithiol-disulfide isomerase